MPYIHCDGKTYSTHSTDPIVKQCIAERNAKQNAEYLACLEEPECKAKIENGQIVMMSVVFFILLFLCGLFYMLYKITND